MPATYEQKRAMMAQQYPEIAAALDQISTSASNYDARRRKPKAKNARQHDAPENVSKPLPDSSSVKHGEVSYLEVTHYSNSPFFLRQSPG